MKKEKAMIIKNKPPIKRPEEEKKFSLKNPADKAIIISLSILVLVISIIIVLIVIFGGLF